MRDGEAERYSIVYDRAVEMGLLEDKGVRGNPDAVISELARLTPDEMASVNMSLNSNASPTVNTGGTYDLTARLNDPACPVPPDRISTASPEEIAMLNDFIEADPTKPSDIDVVIAPNFSDIPENDQPSGWSGAYEPTVIVRRRTQYLSGTRQGGDGFEGDSGYGYNALFWANVESEESGNEVRYYTQPTDDKTRMMDLDQTAGLMVNGDGNFDGVSEHVWVQQRELVESKCIPLSELSGDGIDTDAVFEVNSDDLAEGYDMMSQNGFPSMRGRGAEHTFRSGRDFIFGYMSDYAVASNDFKNDNPTSTAEYHYFQVGTERSDEYYVGAFSSGMQGKVIMQRKSQLDQRASEVENLIRAHYGNHIDGLKVTYDDHDFIVTADGIEGEIRIPYDNREIYDDKLDDSVSSAFITMEEDDYTNQGGQFGTFRFKTYINNNIKYGFENVDIVEEDGVYYLCTDSYRIPVTLDELANYKNCDAVKRIIDIENTKNKYYYDEYGNPIAMKQDIDIIPSGDGYYYYVNGEKIYATSLEEADKGIENKVATNPSYMTSNSKIARRRNKAISDVDEIQYGIITKAMTTYEYDELKIEGADGLDEFCDSPVPSETVSDVNKMLEELKTDAKLLCRMIDSVVYLYVNCDYYMRQVIDGIFSGGVTSEGDFVKADGSFVDYVFQMRNSEDRAKLLGEYTDKYVKVYTNYVNDATAIAKHNKEITSGDKIYLGVLEEEDKLFYESRGLKIDANGCVSLEDFSATFASDIMPQEGTTPSDEAYKYVLRPLNKNLNFIQALEDSPDTVSAINDLEVFRDHPQFIETMLSDEYKTKLEDVRKEGVSDLRKLVIGLEDLEWYNLLFPWEGVDIDKAEYLTPAELALICSLPLDQQYAYVQSLDYKTTKRKGEVLAANELLRVFKNPASSDAISILEGARDGLRGTYMDLYHIFDHDNTSGEWKNYYMAKYISDAATISLNDLDEMYEKGEISRDLYMTYKSLADDSNMAKAKTNRTIYGVAKEVGGAASEILEDIVLTFATGGHGVLLKATAKAILKGLAKTGHIMNEERSAQVYRMLDDDFYVNAIAKGSVKALTTFVVDACKGYIKYGKSGMKYGKLSANDAANAGANAIAAGSATGQVARSVSFDPSSIKDEFLENTVPGMKLLNTILDYGAGGENAGKICEHIGVLFLSYVGKTSEGYLGDWIDYFDGRRADIPAGDEFIRDFFDEVVGYGVVDDLKETLGAIKEGEDVDYVSLFKEFVINPMKKGPKPKAE